MKKTLTVNLNNIVFHIDDDAYDMLQTYLADVEKHLSEDERKEVMNDIEARIAELFTERLQRNKNVINFEDVEEIINVLGKPSQYAENEDEANANEQQPRGDRRRARRYYRDQDKAVLGGVAAGLASFLGWDITLVRIIFVILVFLGVGMMIPIYILVWFIAPAALTAAQRLEMQGEDVTAESIKTEINNVKNYMESDKFKQSAGNVGSRIGQVIGHIFKALFTLIGAVLGFAGMLVLGALIILMMFLIFDPASITGIAPDFFTGWTTLTPEKALLLIISLLLVIGCPVFLLIYWIVRMINGRHEYNRSTYWIVVVLWLAGLFMFYSVGARTFINWSHKNWGDVELLLNEDESVIQNQHRSCEKFHAIEISGNIKLVINQDSVQQVVVSTSDGILPRVYTKVEDGVLKIYTSKIFLNHRVKVFVNVDSLSSVTARGACEIKTDEEIKASDFKIDVIGASEANMDLDVVNETKVDAVGASSVKLNGKSAKIRTHASGASHIDADDFQCIEANAEASGASDVNVFATDKFNGKANGASHVSCKGNPKLVNKDFNAGSSVEVD